MKQTGIRLLKKDLIDRVASKANCDPKLALHFTDAVINVLRDVLINADPGTKIVFREFGSFVVLRTNPKKSAHNPKQPNVKIAVPARRRVSFKVGKSLKAALHEPLSSEGAPKKRKVIL